MLKKHLFRGIWYWIPQIWYFTPSAFPRASHISVFYKESSEDRKIGWAEDFTSDISGIAGALTAE